MSAIQTIRNTVNSLDEIADIIANPPEGQPVRQAIGINGRRVCDAYANLELVTDLLVGPAKSVIALVCKPYFDAEGYDAPEAEVPFTGGQCAGTRYTVSGTYLVSCGADEGQTKTWSASSTSIGPIGGIYLEPGGGWQIETGGTVDPNLIPTGKNFGLVKVPRPGVTCEQLGDGDLAASTTPKITTVTPFSGEPNDCGDPPPQLVPGANRPPSPGPFPTGLQPGVNPDGQPFFFIPDIDVPGGSPITLDDDPLGDGPPPLQPPAGGDGLPGDPAAIDGEAGEVTGGEDGEDIDFGEPPEGRVWIGCIVETSSTPALGNIAGTGPESTVWPTVRANAALNYGSKKGTSYRITSRFHDLIRSATSLIVTGVFLQVLPGSTSKVFPLSALKCPSNPCEEE